MNKNEVLQVIDASTKRVSNISFNVNQGEITAIIGPSGSGKTSLLMMLNRLTELLKGEISYHGKDISTYPITELRRKVGMVFQASSLFEGTVEDNLKYGPSLMGNWQKKIGAELLDKVQLPKNYINRDVENLSGGEKQRVALARTLANDPEIFLLDEVTSALDLQSVELIEQLLVHLAKQENKGIVMVTHNLNQAERISDRTIFMSNGKIEEQGNTADVLKAPSSELLQQFLKE
jgi:putative ABC transport system ATP-binding protein